MDIKVWAQCFATYVRVIAESEPERVPDLLGYMINVIRASQDFVGSAWLTYDDTFWRQVAVSGNRAWGCSERGPLSLILPQAVEIWLLCNYCTSCSYSSLPKPKGME